MILNKRVCYYIVLGMLLLYVDIFYGEYVV